MGKISIIQGIIDKIIGIRFMENFSKTLNKHSISHMKLSKVSGKGDGAFNKLINEKNTPYLTTFLRYWYFAKKLSSKPFNMIEDDFQFDKLLDELIIRGLQVSADISNAELKDYILENKDFFIGLKVYFDLPNNRKTFTDEELLLYQKIYNLIITYEEKGKMKW